MKVFRWLAPFLFVILVFLVYSPCSYAIGEYDGAWIGTETVTVAGESPDIFNNGSIISQTNENELYLSEEALGNIRLVRSGSQWMLSAPISTSFFGYDAVVNSMQVSFPTTTRLSGTINVTVYYQGMSVAAVATLNFTKQSCPALASGVPVANISGAEDSYRCFQIEVPQGALTLGAETAGGTGDCDLGIIFSKPDFTSATSEEDGNSEKVTLSSPQAGRWYVFLYGYLAYSGLTLTATYEAAPVIHAGFGASPTTGKAPLSVIFSDQSTGGVSTWNWSFGDGETSTQQNPTHIYRRPGTYTVSLTVSGLGGTDSETKTDLIMVERRKAASWIPLLLDD